MGTGETLPQEEPKASGAGAVRTRTGPGRAGRWVRGRSVRWVAAGAAVLVIGGGAAAAVAHHHEGEEGHGHGHDRRAAADDRGRHDGRGGRDSWQDREGREGHRGHGGREGRQESGRDVHAVPAPLPSVNAADAVAKASSAVAGGKVESLSPVAEQGGGRAWRVMVLGPDGVRHAVTIDGAGDTITGNTVLGG
ncbi:hypothetical protein AB0C81_12245 [Streptomyces roseoverticillatus]|uniref:hypothetical protein n=1 Tax=Streptomyces roseoverticillatus TaxID=66429 RepID=UPI0033C853FB